MKHQEGFFSDQHQHKIFYQYWLPDDEPVAAVLLCHGLADHSGRYMNLVNPLLEQGYAVYALDHLGHGRSDGKRVYVDSFEQFLQPLKQYSDMIRQWLPAAPQVLLGHSMGGLIVTRYLLQYQNEFSAAIVCAPAVKMPTSVSKLLITAGLVMSRLLPKAGVSKLEYEGVSRDPAVVRAYRNDPLNTLGSVTARLAAEIYDSMQLVQQRSSEIKLPLLVLQGSEDFMVEPSGAPALYDTVSSEDKTIRIYPGLYHEIFNEPEKEQVQHDVVNWLGERVGSKARHGELNG